MEFPSAPKPSKHFGARGSRPAQGKETIGEYFLLHDCSSLPRSCANLYPSTTPTNGTAPRMAVVAPLLTPQCPQWIRSEPVAPGRKPSSLATGSRSSP